MNRHLFAILSISSVLSSSVLSWAIPTPAAPPKIDQTVKCDALIAGGGLAGTAAAYESLLAGRTVCMTEITDWVGGQISSQGTSALDERTTQRERRFFPKGYLEFSDRIHHFYDHPNPGDCWVSLFCFPPKDGHAILLNMLRDAEKRGKGKLYWYPSTVIKDMTKAEGQIEGAIAIQHAPAPGAPPLNSDPLSQTLEDSYQYENSPRFTKQVIQFLPKQTENKGAPLWFVIDATETGELLALADVPYRLGIDPRSYLDPSSASETPMPYCTQGYTYTFAMEQTAEPQPQPKPSFYPQYEPYYSYEKPIFASVDLLFTYRRIWRPENQVTVHTKFGNIGFIAPQPGDISMQNWTWGNDYRPGTEKDNLILTHDQLQQTGQLAPGQWLGGLRVESLRRAEESSLGYYYWLVAGTTDSQLGAGVKKPSPNHRLVTGIDSPMGTLHGLSKYPYMREVRRLIGRPSPGYENGFTISETDITQNDFTADYYRSGLSEREYRALGIGLSGLDAIARIRSSAVPDPVRLRTRSRIYPDSVGIGHFPIDFHPCMQSSPPEAIGNVELPGIRQAQGITYPFQLPLRAMIPQRLDNLIVAGKSIATSQIAAAAYRVQSFEWSAGAAAGTLVDFALDSGIAPYELVDHLPSKEPQLEQFQQRLIEVGNPTAFPETSIFNEEWQDWK
jgi:FAD dependent oxidoreductase